MSRLCRFSWVSAEIALAQQAKRKAESNASEISKAVPTPVIMSLFKFPAELH